MQFDDYPMRLDNLAGLYDIRRDVTSILRGCMIIWRDWMITWCDWMIIWYNRTTIWHVSMINELNVTYGVDNGPNADQAKILWSYCHTLTSMYGSAVQVVCDCHLLHTTACRLQVREPYMTGQAFGVPLLVCIVVFLEHWVHRAWDLRTGLLVTAGWGEAVDSSGNGTLCVLCCVVPPEWLAFRVHPPRRDVDHVATSSA